MKFFSLVILFISTLTHANEFNGSWSVEKLECKDNGQVKECASDYSKIKMSSSSNPEKICIQYDFADNGYHSECLNSFDFSEPEVGLIYKAELALYSDKTGAVYRFTDSDSITRMTRVLTIEKIGIKKFALTEIVQSRNLSSGQVNRQDKVYFLYQ